MELPNLVIVGEEQKFEFTVVSNKNSFKIPV